MLRYAHALWDAFFPTKPVYPVLLAGHDGRLAIEDMDALEAQLQQRYRVFTYRDAFEGLAAEYRMVHSDQGWGCLLRTTQMLLAHFLLRYGSADMVMGNGNSSNTTTTTTTTNAAAPSAAARGDGDGGFPWRLFCDSSSTASPFSLHNMVRSVYGERTFRPEYWSPSQGCEALRRTVHAAVRTGALRTPVTVLVASNSCFFHADVMRALRPSPSPSPSHRRRRGMAEDGDAAAAAAVVVLLLAPVRVSAAAQLTQEAYLQLERLLELPGCLGMVGGVPGRSYFFFAHNQTQLLYLDPHQSTQLALHCHSDGDAVRLLVPSRDDVHCVHWSRVDTSLFLAFALRRVREWRQLRECLRSVHFLHVDDSGSADKADVRTTAASAPVCVPPSSRTVMAAKAPRRTSTHDATGNSHHGDDATAYDDKDEGDDGVCRRGVTATTTPVCPSDSWYTLDDGCKT